MSDKAGAADNDRDRVKRITTSNRVDRIVARLQAAGMPAADLQGLCDMINSPVEEFGHTEVMRVLRELAAEFDIDDDDDVRLLWYKNVEQYRWRWVAKP